MFATGCCSSFQTKVLLMVWFLGVCCCIPMAAWRRAHLEPDQHRGICRCAHEFLYCFRSHTVTSKTYSSPQITGQCPTSEQCPHNWPPPGAQQNGPITEPDFFSKVGPHRGGLGGWFLGGGGGCPSSPLGPAEDPGKIGISVRVRVFSTCNRCLPVHSLKK